MEPRSHYLELPLSQLFAACQRERAAYSASGVEASPACVELVRRSLAGDDQAWALLQGLFEPLLRAWIGVQRRVEPEDVLQEAWLAFARWAPGHAELATGAELGRALAFLRQCTKTALLMQLRKARGPQAVPLDMIALAAPDDVMAAAEHRIVIYERAAQLVSGEQERIVFRELLVYGRKPQAILSHYPAQFATMQALRATIQRVLRRLRKDEELRRLL